jgi:hypothetical protein
MRLRRRQANTDRGVATRRRTTRPFQQRTARGGRAPLAQPGCAPRAWRAGKAGGLARHAWTDRPYRRPSAWFTRSANRDRAAGQRRQPRRRRITPNTNTTTTTMISTHNHVDMAASLVGPGQLKLTLLPATRASNSVTARPPSGPDRRPRCAPARGDPCGGLRGCPAWVGDNASLAVPMRDGRRRAAGAGPTVRAFGEPESHGVSPDA